MARFSVISPVESNGGVPVNIQDQTTRLLDLYFLKVDPASFTTLSADAAPNDRTVTLTSTTGFVAGSMIGLSTATESKFYFGVQLGAPVGNVITLDTPLDDYFLTGTNAFSTSFDLNVNGDVTPQIFQIGPVGVGTGLEVDLTRVMGYMEHASAMDDSKFGGRAALTKGIVLRRKYNGTYQSVWNAKTNGEMSLICASDFFYTSKAPAGFNGARFRNTFGGQEKHGVVVRLAPTETLELVIQDDLTSFNRFNMMAQGHFTQN